MSFSSPQTVTVDTVANTLHRTQSEPSSSTYVNADGSLTMKVSHQKGKSRTRRMVRIDQRLVVADPLTGLSAYQTIGAYFVIDEPNTGIDDDSVTDLVTGLQAWLTLSNVQAVLASRH